MADLVKLSELDGWEMFPYGVTLRKEYAEGIRADIRFDQKLCWMPVVSNFGHGHKPSEPGDGYAGERDLQSAVDWCDQTAEKMQQQRAVRRAQHEARKGR